MLCIIHRYARKGHKAGNFISLFIPYTGLALTSGTSLTKLKENIEETEETYERKTVLECTHQVTLNFIGIDSQSSHLPIGDIFDVNKFNPEQFHGADCCFIYIECIMLAYYFHEYDAAREMAEKCRKYIHYGEI